MPATVVKDETFYTPTYLTDPQDGKVSLFLRRLELRERVKSGPLVKCYQDVVHYPDEQAMVAAIELHGWEELPAEAESDLLFVPDGWAPPEVPVERGFHWMAPTKWWTDDA